MIPTDSQEDIKVRLYLQAVIPALQMLVQIDPESLQLARKLTRPVRLLVGQGQTRETTMGWGGDVFRCAPDMHRAGTLTLWFPFPSRFLAMMENNAIPVAIPVSGWTALGQLSVFEKLMKRLEVFLKPGDSGDLPQKVHMQLAVATACVPVLGAHDGPSQRQLRQLPEGIALFSCEPGLPPCWVKVAGGHAESGIGASPVPPRVSIHFADAETGHAALSDKLDQMAAVGNGSIRMSGLVPLADGLDLILNRIKTYLPTP